MPNVKNMRYHAIDKIRAAMILTVAFGHSMLPYVTIPRKFQDPATSIGFDIVAIFLLSFAMDLFFVTAGFSAALLLAKYGPRNMLKNRWYRIFVPFLVAWAVIAPLSRGAIEFAAKIASTGDIDAGIEVLARWDWLSWSKIYHLWFLPALMLFALAAVGLRRALLSFSPQLAKYILTISRNLIVSPWLAAWLVLLTVVPTVNTNLSEFGALSNTYSAAFTLFCYFLLGWLLFLQRALLTRMRSRYRLLFGLAAVVLPATVWASRIRLFSDSAPDPFVGVIAGIGNTVLAAAMTIGLLMLFQSRLNQPSRAWRYCSDASYWIYLVHYPLVIAVGGIVSVTPFPAFVKYLTTLSIAVPVLYASYQYGARRTALNPAS